MYKEAASGLRSDLESKRIQNNTEEEMELNKFAYAHQGLEWHQANVGKFATFQNGKLVNLADTEKAAMQWENDHWDELGQGSLTFRVGAKLDQEIFS